MTYKLYYKTMKLYLITINGKAFGEAYTSLLGAGKVCGMSKSSVSHGKRVRVSPEGDVYVISEAVVVRIKGRKGGKF